MTSQQDTSSLVNQTVQALGGSPSDASPMDGASLVDSWISTLGPDSPVSDRLMALQQALQSGSPDSTQISSMLMSLSEQTESAASSADSDLQSSLQQVAQSLRSFAQQL